MAGSCHPLLQLNHFAQKTEAKKVSDLRMTILMQNQKFQSRSCFLLLDGPEDGDARSTRLGRICL
jgi:hypothetical protein